MKNKLFLANRSGIRLDKYLSEEIPEFSRTKLKSFIINDQVRVNGNVEKSSYPVQENDKIEICFVDEDDKYVSVEPENIPFDVIYEDEHLALINKDRKSTRLNSNHTDISRMPSSA